MDQSSEGGAREPVSWSARASQYGFTLVFIAPLYFAAGAGGEIIGHAVTGEQGLHNLLPAAAAIYILHRCLWD